MGLWKEIQFMKRFLILSLVLGACVKLSSPAAVQAGPPSFPGNGDVNDDGSRDLSDAIYLLAHLFQGGPAPALCSVPAEPEVLLPATNQTLCYDTTFGEPPFPPELYPMPDCDVFNCTVLSPPSCTVDMLPQCWDALGITDERYCHQCLSSLIPDPDEGVAPDGTVEVNCATAPASGQDGRLLIGTPTAGRFVDNTDGTVTDTVTGLMWTQDIVDASGDGVGNHDDNVNWCAALNACEDLDFAGNDDWRLPNIRELESLLDYGGGRMIHAAFSPFVIDPGDPGDPGGAPPIPAIPPRETGFVFWSSTTYDINGQSDPGTIGSMDLAHCVFFADSDIVHVVPRYAGSFKACLKSDNNCICDGSVPGCVEDDRLDKIYLRGVRTVPLSGGAGGATSGNGDVNGDNSLDLSDAIYLLNFLFQGGPSPVDCPESGGGAGLLDVNNIGRLTSTLLTGFGVSGCYEEVAPEDWSGQVEAELIHLNYQ